jgi:hypothetical protein
MVDEHCCRWDNEIFPTGSATPRPPPTGQILSAKCSHAIGVTALVIFIFEIASSTTIILVLLFIRGHDRERGPSFLGGIYG